MLELLELDYEVKLYARNSNHMAPKEAKKLTPLGLFPFLQVYKNGSTEPVTMAESGHIISYLARNHDPQGKLKTANAEDYELVDYYLHFAEGTLQPHLVALLVGSIACQRTPWPANYLVKQVTSRMGSLYYGLRVMEALEFLDAELEKKGGSYFVGDSLTAADVILDFPINRNIFGNDRLQEVGLDFDPKTKYPNLYKWHQLTTSLPSHIRSVAREKLELAKL